ncbi:MAG: hypothetical protein U0M12_05615 [Acutalibacteraceae bacterium]|nr:hypothetical protein [Acutalibacteraceae bacterium]
MSEYKKQWAIEQLKNKSEELGRVPKKDDFDDATRSRIKAFLGPWPRALEAAELKTPSKRHKSNSSHRRARNLKDKESKK